MLTNNFNSVNTNILPLPTVSEDDCELVLKYITFIIDISGSMSNDIKKVYTSFEETLLSLQSINNKSIDIENVVKLAFFNDDTTPANDVHQKPEKLLDMISADDFNCKGRTNEHSVIEFIDNELSRKNPAIANLRKNAPDVDFVIITDGQSNDAEELREKARRRLESNHYYQKGYARIIVIYIGENDRHKKTAIALAGGKEENVISLSDDLAPMLSSFIIKNTVIRPDATHMGDNEEGTTTLKDSADEIMKREQQGTLSVDELTENDIDAMLSKLMGKDVR